MPTTRHTFKFHYLYTSFLTCFTGWLLYSVTNQFLLGSYSWGLLFYIIILFNLSQLLLRLWLKNAELLFFLDSHMLCCWLLLFGKTITPYLGIPTVVWPPLWQGALTFVIGSLLILLTENGLINYYLARFGGVEFFKEWEQRLLDSESTKKDL